MASRVALGLLVIGLIVPAALLAQESNPSPAPGKQIEMSLTTSDGATVGYLLYLPDNYDVRQQLPLMLFLHGRGESNGPLSLVAKWGPPRMAARGDNLPYVIVSPQCPRDDNWASPVQQARLIELLDHATEQWKIDTERIYLTGLSMGGFGSWRLAAGHADRFAAVAPICGGASSKHAEALKSLPIWAFHGDQDRIVPMKRTTEIVDAIKAAGGTSIRLTTLEGVGHNSWSSAYATPDLYIWMNKQRRGKD